jgi:hypothetical protein
MNIPSWARVGAKVVCVDARWFEGTSPLVNRSVYTVVSVGHSSGQGLDGRSGRFVCLELLEAANPTDSGDPDGDPGFDICRFRPLITRSQEDDLAIFRPLLVPTKETQDA